MAVGADRDLLFDVLHRAEVDEYGAEAGEFVVGEVGADLRPEGGRRGRIVFVRTLERRREQCRALALAKIVTRRLARDCRVAEHAQHVVAELERDPDVGAERPVRGDEFGVRTGDRGAELQRAFHRVRGRLVLVDAQRRIDVFVVARLVDQVEQLAVHDLGAHRGPHR